MMMGTSHNKLLAIRSELQRICAKRKLHDERTRFVSGIGTPTAVFHPSFSPQFFTPVFHPSFSPQIFTPGFHPSCGSLMLRPLDEWNARVSRSAKICTTTLEKPVRINDTIQSATLYDPVPSIPIDDCNIWPFCFNSLHILCKLCKVTKNLLGIHITSTSLTICSMKFYTTLHHIFLFHICFPIEPLFMVAIAD